jgi:hypothetical protein
MIKAFFTKSDSIYHTLRREMLVNIKKSILVLLLLVICSLIFSLAFRDNLGLDVRIINDYFDRSAFALRGSWFSLSKAPYTEVFSEYPQVATYFFALPYILMEPIISQNKTLIELIQIPDPPNSIPQNQIVFDYATVFSLLMMVFSFLSISLLYQLRGNQKISLLLLLPSSFYFTFNRFDIMVCFLVLLSLYLLSRKCYKMSALLPIFLTYYYSIHRKINWSMILTFSLTSLIIILPTIISGGIDGLLIPYKFGFSKNQNVRESLLYLINHVFKKVFNIGFVRNITLLLFFLFQFFGIPLCITSKIVSFDKVVKWSALSILIFMLFAKFYSPQWILWISPLLILSARKKSDTIWIILFDLLTYIYFPIFYDIYCYIPGITNIMSISTWDIFISIIFIKTIFLVGFALSLLFELIKDNMIFIFAQRHLAPRIRSQFL